MRIVFCGVGALGSTAAVLCRNLEATMAFVDFDRVESKNVLAQAYVKQSIGKNKAEALKLQLSNFYGIKAEAFGVRVTAESVEALCGTADLIVDCFDNAKSRAVLSGFARKASRPLLHAAISADGTFGLVRWDEVQAGAIRHAIRFTAVQSDQSFLWPARHQAGSAANPALPPMGARFRLKGSYDISHFSAQARVILLAMQHYGLILADNGSNWFFSGTEDAAWPDSLLSELKTVPASQFEAVDESGLMQSANSAAVKPACPTSGGRASNVPPPVCVLTRSSRGGGAPPRVPALPTSNPYRWLASRRLG